MPNIVKRFSNVVLYKYEYFLSMKHFFFSERRFILFLECNVRFIFDQNVTTFYLRFRVIIFFGLGCFLCWLKKFEHSFMDIWHDMGFTIHAVIEGLRDYIIGKSNRYEINYRHAAKDQLQVGRGDNQGGGRQGSRAHMRSNDINGLALAFVVYIVVVHSSSWSPIVFLSVTHLSTILAFILAIIAGRLFSSSRHIHAAHTDTHTPWWKTW